MSIISVIYLCSVWPSPHIQRACCDDLLSTLGDQLLWHSLLQVKVPQSGVRVLVASDGVWDAFEKMLRVCRMARSWSVEVSQFPIMDLLLPQ